MSILGADLADVHGEWDSAWRNVGLNNRERILWGYIRCCSGWDTAIIIDVSKVIIQRGVVVCAWIVSHVVGVGVGVRRGCDRT